MALDTLQNVYNESILTHLVGQHFALVKNKSDLTKKLLSLFSDHNIALNTYGGEYRKPILNAIAATIQNNNFDVTLADSSIAALKRELNKLDAKTRLAHSQQAPELTVINQLKRNGYVQPGHLLTHTDIQQFLSHHLGDNPGVELFTPISLTQDGGRALADALKIHKNSDKLAIIPVNVDGNHWTLLYGHPSRGSFTYWDSMNAKPHANAIVNSVVSSVIGASAKISYQATQEQKDGVTCGQRISQQALKVAGVTNDFTAVPTNDSSALSYHFVKTLATATPEFGHESIGVVEDDSAPLVYLGENNPEANNVIAEKRMLSEQSDQYLALTLQQTYIDNPTISDEDALIRAKNSLSKLTYQELEQTKQRLASWYETTTSSSFFAKTPTKRNEQLDNGGESENIAIKVN